MIAKPPAGPEATGASPRVLLVYPEITSGTYWSYSEALRFLGKQCSLPPLGLLTVAGLLPETTPLRLADLNVAPLRDEDLAWADVVFVSAMIVQRDSFHEVVARARAAGTAVVAGGPYPSTALDEMNEVEHLVIGEAERILPTFWDDFLSGEAKRVYARPVEEAEAQALAERYGETAHLVVDPKRPELAEAPTPRFDLLDMSAYRAMAVQTSRGCPVGCEFCDIWRRFGRTSRSKPADRLETELDALHALGWRDAVFVVDDNFIGSPAKAKARLARIADWQRAHGYPFSLFTEATLTLADDPELLQAMQDAGFDMVFIGIETPSEESLRETGKFINTRGSMADKVAAIQGKGIQVTAGFILGFDNDPEDIADRMIRCIHDLGIPVAMVGLLQALPETDLYDRLAREGRLRSEASGNNTHGFEPNFVTTRPVADLVADYKQVLQTLYGGNLANYFARARVLMDRFGTDGPSLGSLQWMHLRAFLLLLLTLPFRRYRGPAARFLLRALVTKPRFFHTAVALCVQGHHFFTITRRAFEAEHVESHLRDSLAAFRAGCRELIATHYDRASRSGQYVLAEIRQRRDTILADAWARISERSRDVRAALETRVAAYQREITLAAAEAYFEARLAAFRTYCAEHYTRAARSSHHALAEASRRREEILEDAAHWVRQMGQEMTDAREAVYERYDRFVHDLETTYASVTGSAGPH